MNRNEKLICAQIRCPGKAVALHDLFLGIGATVATVGAEGKSDWIGASSDSEE